MVGVEATTYVVIGVAVRVASASAIAAEATCSVGAMGGVAANVVATCATL
jgi:hypothetical protein